MKIVQKFLSFLFPPICVGCGQEDFLVCPKCRLQIPAKIQQKSFHLPYFQEIVVFTDYEHPVVEAAIKKLKFRFARHILEDLKDFFTENFPHDRIPSDALFVPVPLYFLRQNERGFNQSDFIAKVFSQVSHGGIWALHLIRRIRNTPHQSHLSKEAREQNVKNAFQVNKSVATRIPCDAPIILVDDVVTTGSTLLECAKALHEYGYRYIWGLAIARGN